MERGICFGKRPWVCLLRASGAGKEGSMRPQRLLPVSCSSVDSGDGAVPRCSWLVHTAGNVLELECFYSLGAL